MDSDYELMVFSVVEEFGRGMGGDKGELFFCRSKNPANK